MKKENLVVPLIISMCFLPADIPINIGSLHFYAVRILGLLSLLRIYSSPNKSAIILNVIDKLFISYNLLGALIYIIASQDTNRAFIYTSGTLVDSIALYIALRYSIRSKENIITISKTFCYCVILLLPFIVFEYFTAQNLFAVLGRDSISFRDGAVRAAGTFSHSILFGSFAAAVVPVLWGSYKYRNNRTILLAIACCVFFVISSSSSGPIVALAASISFLIFFRWRQYSSRFAWSLLLVAIFIHFIREMPLWHFLYVRISIHGGSTGYHRYLLVEAAIKEFWNWWILGYGDIGPKWHEMYWPRNHAKFTDVTNQYLLVGVRGGFFTMLLFINLCFKSIKILGTHAISQPDQKTQWLWWGFCVMMITHCVTFLSVGYFGQITMLLNLTIATAAFALDDSKKHNSVESNLRYIK
ncbi:MAG: O-antigen ligase family protein [Chlorobium sp.]|nr:O-antigen ligase family protein [Chlorobium sp.]